MKRKAFALTLVLALLVSTVWIENVETTRADPVVWPEAPPSNYKIFINGTSNIENLHGEGRVFTLTGDINHTIVIEKDFTVLDGAGYTLQGNGNSSGIWLQDKYNVTIKNLNIRGFDYGIRISHYVPEWHSGQKNPTFASKCTIQSCNITNNVNGISLYQGTFGCNIMNNFVANNTYGITFGGSSNIFRNNRIDGNRYDFWEDQDAGLNDVDTSNTVNGKPIYYWVSQQNLTVPENAGAVVLKECSGIVVKDLNLTGQGVGLALYHTNNSRIIRNNISDNYWRGIAVWWSNNNSILYNRIANNTMDGIEDGDTFNDTISHNLITGSSYGIYYSNPKNGTISSNQIIANQKAGIFGSSNIIITDNYVFGNQGNGIRIYSNCVISRNNITLNRCKDQSGWLQGGVGLIFYSNCTITKNFISKNNYGIAAFVMDGGPGSNITLNTIAENNHHGIWLHGYCENNLIYNNNFIGNTAQAYAGPLSDRPTRNAWDNGVNGNYWSDHNNSSPYYLEHKNQDRYPLLAPLAFEALEIPSTQPPQVTLEPSLNGTFTNSTVPLVFFLDREVSWMGYCLDGETAVTIYGNTTIANVINGNHSLTVYVNDTYGNYAASQTLNFTVAVPKPFPTATVAVVSAFAVVVAAVGLLVYFKKRK